MEPPSYSHATGQLEHRRAKEDRTYDDRNFDTVYDSNSENSEVNAAVFTTFDFFLLSLYYNVLLMLAYVLNYVIDFLSEVE